MMEAKPASGVPSQAGSELNTSVGGMSQSQSHQPLERRVAWLEEDVAVIHRRVKLECGEIGGGGGGDSALRQLVSRLDGELTKEKKARQMVEARLASLEESVARDRVEREATLKSFSTELEGVMRGLIGRIDEGLSQGAASMKERTDQTEVRMRHLIKRVDEGLSAGAAALKDTLTNTGEKLGSISETREQPPPRSTRPSGERGAASRGTTSPITQQQQQQLMQVRAAQAQMASRQRSPQSSQAPSHFRSPVQTPSSAYPCSLQVPGSGLNNMHQGGPVPHVPQPLPGMHDPRLMQQRVASFHQQHQAHQAQQVLNHTR